MSSLLGLENLPLRAKPGPGTASHRGPKLLVELEPWGRTFGRNLADFLCRRQPPAIPTTSAPAPFWPDVFVSHRLPWNAFAESILYHAVVIAFAWGLSSLFASRPQIAKQRPFDPHDVIYYSPFEYLPPLDTGKSHAAQPLKGEPVYAKQPILSVPPEADNHHQTIVTPPNIKLTHDVATLNIVAWGNANLPVPTAATERKPLPAPTLPSQIVAPAPDIDQTAQRSRASLSTSIVAPPPDVDPGKVRATASLSIDVIAPTPDAMAAVDRSSSARRNSEKPMMLLSGVRSSWDMFARNSLFIRFASRTRSFWMTRSRFRCSSCSRSRFWSVMSRAEAKTPRSRPSVSRNVVAL